MGFAQEVIARPQALGVIHIRRDVVGIGDIRPAGVGKRVGCNGTATIEDREHLPGDAHIDSAANELVRHGVPHAGYGDVEIWGDLGAFPLGALPRGIGKLSLIHI